MSLSKIFLSSCLFFIGGIFLASFWKGILRYRIGPLIYLMVFLLFFSIWKKKKTYIFISLFVLFILLGLLDYQKSILKVEQTDLNEFNGQRIRLIGQVVNEPETVGNKTKLIVKPIKIVSSKGKLDKINFGQLLIVTNFLFPHRYGEIVDLVGKVTLPPVFKDFNYRMFLAKSNIYSIVYYPKINLISLSRRSNFYSFIFSLKAKLRKVIESNFLPRQALLLRALILGDKNYLTKGLKNELNIAGVRHIVAISGMHIAIIESILVTLLLALGFWRNQALDISLIVCFIFVALTGFQSSAIRAWIMGSFAVWAEIIGRKSDSLRILIFTASLMLMFNPLLLRYDIGFQLSFLAVLGIIYLGELFNYWFRFIPNWKWLNLREILVMTFSAQFFTFPFLIYYFGHVSLVAPLTNTLIIPVIPFLILFGFLSSLIGLVWPFLSLLLAFPCWFFLFYIDGIISLVSQWPVYPQLNFPFLIFVIAYPILILEISILKRKLRWRFLDY